MKKSSKFLPVIGWSMWFSEYLFLERSWAKDERTLKSGLQQLQDFPLPFWLALFVEGTRFTQAKLEAAQEYAASAGLPVPRKVLVPRTKRLEVHAKTLYTARAEDEKRIQELERELKNCYQEIDYLQDQLNGRNEEVYCLGEHVHSLELKLADMESLEEKVGRLREELKWSNSEHLILMQELESKEVELQQSAACIEKLEESISPVSLEYQCEIESMKFDLEQNCFEAKKFKEEVAREKLRMNELIQDFECQIQDAQKVVECLNEENKELREKFETSEKNARVFCQKMEEQFEEWLENDGPPLNTQPLSHELEKDVRTCGDILGPLLFRLAVDAAFKDKIDKMSCQILEYELLLKQLKEELRAEKLKAKEEAEDLAQEMAELRYQITGLLEEERKRRACIEQISLQRIAELEAQIQREQRKTFSSVKLIHEA